MFYLTEAFFFPSSVTLTHALFVPFRFQNQLSASKQNSGASRGVYVFSDMNPYVGHPNPMQEGQELFRKGLLSEAVLALEAEVLKNPDNAEGWRLLGVTHAENDDDQQVIVSLPLRIYVDVNYHVLIIFNFSLLVFQHRCTACLCASLVFITCFIRIFFL